MPPDHLIRLYADRLAQTTHDLLVTTAERDGLAAERDQLAARVTELEAGSDR